MDSVYLYNVLSWMVSFGIGTAGMAEGSGQNECEGFYTVKREHNTLCEVRLYFILFPWFAPRQGGVLEGS